MAGRVGIILVHGIGEQKRFSHLDSELRNIIDGFKRRPNATVSVEILPAGAAVYQAEQDTWAAGPDPSVRITVAEPGAVTEINVHEVWWADVNEPFSLAKQVRFWAWGLSVWSFPRTTIINLPGFAAMHWPGTPGQTTVGKLRVRIQLFLAGLFFLVAAFSLGAAVFLARRLLGFEAPDVVRVFVNYLSSVKLYNQRTRQGGKLLPNRHAFLDTLDDPPRVSIRRRMVNAIVAVASREDEYDRWYILGHSLGSVVAFNGIMEHGQALANYLNRETWNALVRRSGGPWAGQARTGDWVQNPPGPMSPSRPSWLRNTDMIYRDELFRNFRGLFTYGSPLGKFAELWPKRVPVNKVEPVFRDEVEWINVFDGRDPVSGPLRAFAPAILHNAGVTPNHCPSLKSLGYAASNVLLLSHIRYLTATKQPGPQLTDLVATWLVTGAAFPLPPATQARWYGAESSTYRRRLFWSWVQWLVAFFVLAIIGAATAGWLLKALLTGLGTLGSTLASFWMWLGD